MPYIVVFRKRVDIADPDLYINPCCIGGDVVLDQLLPMLEADYGDVEAGQEDWGWFAWFGVDKVKLAVDIYANDPETGEFQILLTSRTPRFLLGDNIEDTPALEAVREAVAKKLEAWDVEALTVERVDEDYAPLA